MNVYLLVFIASIKYTNLVFSKTVLLFCYLCPQTTHWRFVLVSVHLKATNLDMSDLPKLKVNMKSS